MVEFRVNNCCYCISVENGTKILSCLGLFWSALSFLVYAFVFPEGSPRGVLLIFFSGFSLVVTSLFVYAVFKVRLLFPVFRESSPPILHFLIIPIADALSIVDTHRFMIIVLSLS